MENKGDAVVNTFNKDLEYDMDTTVLSMYDLMSDKVFAKAVLEGDIDTVNKLLYLVGVDVLRGYTITNRVHRPLMSRDKLPIEGGVLVYVERQDKEWIQSGCASIDAVINSSTDEFLREDLWRIQDAYLTYGKVYNQAATD